MAEYIQVIITVPTKEKNEKETGYTLFVKTKNDLYSKLEKEILSIHSYQVPEIIALSIVMRLSYLSQLN